MTEFNSRKREEKKVRKQEGTLCENCGGSGYKGRVAAYELLMMNSSIRDSIKQKKSTHEIEQEAIQSGMIILKRYAVSLIEQQLTTISELQKELIDAFMVEDPNYVKGVMLEEPIFTGQGLANRGNKKDEQLARSFIDAYFFDKTTISFDSHVKLRL